MNRKTLLIVGILLLIAFLGLASLLRAPAPKKTEPVATTPQPVNPAALPPPVESVPIAYSGSLRLTFPDKVPYYSVARHKSFGEESARLLALFNISGKADTIVGSKGKYISFSWQGRSALLSENPLSFSYTLNTPSARFISNDINAYRKTLDDTISEYSLLPSAFATVLSKQTYLSFDGPHPTELAGPERAQIIQMDLSATIDSFPVFVNDAETPAFSGSFNGDGALAVFRAMFLPDVNKAPSPVGIISFDEAQERLKGNKGVLSSVSLSNRGEGEFATGDVPDAVEIESATLGYFYSQKQDNLIPVFVFTGKGREPGSSAVLKTTTIVSALP